MIPNNRFLPVFVFLVVGFCVLFCHCFIIPGGFDARALGQSTNAKLH
jgi:hypothetical protein